MASDTYTPAQAAQILGLSERRIRQLVSEGKLDGKRLDGGVVHISQRSVNDERKRRKGKTQTRKSSTSAGKRAARGSSKPEVDVEQLADKVASAVGQRLEGQLEITRRAESLVRDELDEERARRVQAEAKLAEAERRIAEFEERAKKRGLFRR
jgi:excisionase family DNA binding protein